MVYFTIEEREVIKAYSVIPAKKSATMKLIEEAISYSDLEGKENLGSILAKIQNVSDKDFSALNLSNILD